MYLTGFADEAGQSIDIQIKATKELGWKNIEARNVNGKNLTDISDAEFDEVCEKLEAAGVKINCFGSAICNWAKHIDKLDADTSFEEARRAIPRMKKLGTKLIRIMSYAILPDRSPEDQMFEKRVEKVTEICKMFTDEGLLPVHENCMNYGGMGHTYTLKLIEAIPGLKLVFDTGNPAFSDDHTKPQPYPKQSAWEFYSNVKDHIAYIHIKDYRHDPNKEKGECFTFAGEGEGDVKRIVKDLLDSGYNGGISMEPHIAAVYHDPSVTSDDEKMYNAYVEYGRRFFKLLEEIGYPYSEK